MTPWKFPQRLHMLTLNLVLLPYLQVQILSTQLATWISLTGSHTRTSYQHRTRVIGACDLGRYTSSVESTGSFRAVFP